jgi:glycerol uptake facilitator protein
MTEISLGAHCNPAVTLALLTLRKVTITQSLFYIVGQLVGAFLSSPVIYLVYLSYFNLYDGGHRQIRGPTGTADIFYTMPATDIPNWNCLVDSIVGTCVLMIFIMSVGNNYNDLISNAVKPFSFIVVITAFGLGMSANCGNPINPVS